MYFLRQYILSIHIRSHVKLHLEVGGRAHAVWPAQCKRSAKTRVSNNFGRAIIGTNPSTVLEVRYKVVQICTVLVCTVYVLKYILNTKYSS